MKWGLSVQIHSRAQELLPAPLPYKALCQWLAPSLAPHGLRVVLVPPDPCSKALTYGVIRQRGWDEVLIRVRTWGHGKAFASLMRERLPIKSYTDGCMLRVPHLISQCQPQAWHDMAAIHLIYIKGLLKCPGCIYKGMRPSIRCKGQERVVDMQEEGPLYRAIRGNCWHRVSMLSMEVFCQVCPQVSSLLFWWSC